MSERNQGVPVVLRGKKHVLKYDFNAFASMEDAGLPVTEVGRRMQKTPVAAIRLLVWAGLLHENPALTVQEAGAMLDLDTEAMKDLAEKLQAAVELALPRQTGSENGSRPLERKREGGTG